jgi:hypothetical protein
MAMMLTIRDQQIQTFQGHARNRYVRAFLEYLRITHPDSVQTKSDQEIDALIRGGIARAETLGLRDEGAIAGFLTLLFLAGPDFDRQPGLHEILNDASLEPGERIVALISRIPRDAGAKFPVGSEGS